MVDFEKRGRGTILINNGASGQIRKPWWYGPLQRGELESVYIPERNISYLVDAETGEIVDGLDWADFPWR